MESLDGVRWSVCVSELVHLGLSLNVRISLAQLPLVDFLSMNGVTHPPLPTRPTFRLPDLCSTTSSRFRLWTNMQKLIKIVMCSSYPKGCSFLGQGEVGWWCRAGKGLSDLSCSASACARWFDLVAVSVPQGCFSLPRTLIPGWLRLLSETFLTHLSW